MKGDGLIFTGMKQKKLIFYLNERILNDFYLNERRWTDFYRNEKEKTDFFTLRKGD